MSSPLLSMTPSLVQTFELHFSRPSCHVVILAATSAEQQSALMLCFRKRVLMSNTRARLLHTFFPFGSHNKQASTKCAPPPRCPIMLLLSQRLLMHDETAILQNPSDLHQLSSTAKPIPLLHLLHRPKPPLLLPRQPPRRRSIDPPTPVPILTPLNQPLPLLPPPLPFPPRAPPITLPHPPQHWPPLADFAHSVLERRRVRQPAYIFGHEAQGQFEVSPCKAEGLEGGAVGGEAGLLIGLCDGAWGWGWGRVVDLLGVVLFFQ